MVAVEDIAVSLTSKLHIPHTKARANAKDISAKFCTYFLCAYRSRRIVAERLLEIRTTITRIRDWEASRQEFCT